MTTRIFPQRFALPSALRAHLSQFPARLRMAGAARLTALACLTALLGTASAPDSQTAKPATRQAVCACPGPQAGEPLRGVVWQGDPGSVIDLPAIAHMLAPILWFSSDEPLLLRSANPIPQPHPGDAPANSAVVYFQAIDLILRGQEHITGPLESEPRFFEKVAQVRIKYFFYYPEDIGLKPHRHDLEAVVMSVHLDQLDDGCRRIRVDRVEGLAHGLDWYSNILRVADDTVFPLTVLVEEGKHASAPDRNADGVYTPGYDSNVRINDAWGIRDVLGSAVLLGSRYTASMSKPRDEGFRLFPPAGPELCGQRMPPSARGSASLGRYILRPAAQSPGGIPPGPDAKRLFQMMRFHRFGPDWPTKQYSSISARSLSTPDNVFRILSGFNFRWDTDRVGGSIQGPGLDLREVWVVPRFLLMDGWATEAIVTPSASRWVDWYAALGYERDIIRIPASDGGNPELLRGFASELGLKFRVTMPGRARWAVLGYRFSGIRLGIRTSGFNRMREPRFVIEIGAGAF